MLAKDQGAQPFLKQLRNASLDNDICLEFLAEPLWAKITKATGKSTDNALAAMGNPMLAGLAKEVKSVSIKLNFSGKTLLHAEIATVKPETAAMFTAIAQKSVTDLKPNFEEMKKQPPPMMPPPLVPIISKLGDEVFEGLKVKAEGPLMEIDLAMPASLPDALKAASEMAAQTQTPKPSRTMDIERSDYKITVPDKCTVDPEDADMDLDHMTTINLPNQNTLSVMVVDDKTLLDKSLERVKNNYKNSLKNAQEAPSNMVNMHKGKAVLVTGVLNGMKYCLEVGAFAGKKAGFVIVRSYPLSDKAATTKLTQKAIETFRIPASGHI